MRAAAGVAAAAAAAAVAAADAAAFGFGLAAAVALHVRFAMRSNVFLKQNYDLPVCPRGQGGGLKIHCRQLRVGSNPTAGTTKK